MSGARDLALAAIILAAVGLAGAIYSWRTMPGTSAGASLSVACGTLAVIGLALAVLSVAMSLGALQVTDVPWDDLDPEIVAAVHALADYEVDTFSSCQGGEGHPGYGGMPVILFHGDEHAGLWAVWLLETQGFRVQTLSRNWDLDFGLRRQPFWQVTMRTLEPMGPYAGSYRVLREVEEP